MCRVNVEINNNNHSRKKRRGGGAERITCVIWNTCSVEVDHSYVQWQGTRVSGTQIHFIHTYVPITAPTTTSRGKE